MTSCSSLTIFVTDYTLNTILTLYSVTPGIKCEQYLGAFGLL